MPAKDWKQISDANHLQIPDSDLERIGPALDGLETSFRPLARSIPGDIEPALIFRPLEDAE